MTNYEYDELCSCMANCSRYGLDAVERGKQEPHIVEYGQDFFGCCKFICKNHTLDVEDVKPLLRPMSDIRDLEVEKIQKITGIDKPFDFSSNHFSLPLPIARIVLEYLDSRFLDYRNLIGLGNAEPVGYEYYFK